MKEIPIAGILAIIFGIAIILVTNVAPYLVGVYLILSGIIAVTRRQS